LKTWWVNHKQTWRQEVSGGYLWSPKVESSGARSEFYNNMRRTSPGDMVVSFQNAQVAHLGIVTGFAITAPTPLEFDPSAAANWQREGWLVPVSWSKAVQPIRVKEHIVQIRPLLPEKYSPIIPSTGGGSQKAYLAEISPELFEVVLDLTRSAPPSTAVVDGLSVSESWRDRAEDRIQAQIEDDRSLDDTMRHSLVAARRGQGKFRANLERVEATCRVCGLADRRLLIASHIKPWAICETAAERLDGNNGLLLAPHVDRLFDIGLISFEDDGRTLVSSKIATDALRALGLAALPKMNVGGFSDGQRGYLDVHRSRIFQE
jgi:putative restriction endonuclease